MDLRVADFSSVRRANFSREVIVEEVMEAESSRKRFGGQMGLGGVSCEIGKDDGRRLLIFYMLFLYQIAYCFSID